MLISQRGGSKHARTYVQCVVETTDEIDPVYSLLLYIRLN